MSKYDAIVVGAGLAGVTAARELQHRGLKTLVLEARPRLGGRAWTTDFAGGPIEMGGQNVHWTEPFIWSEITRYGMKIQEIPPFETYCIATKDGLERYSSKEALLELGKGFDAFYEGMADVIPRPHDPLHFSDRVAAIDNLSVQDRLNQITLTPDSARWLMPWLTMRCGGSLETGAFAWMVKFYAAAGANWMKMLEYSSRYRLTEGMGVLAKHILDDSKAEVRFNSPVVGIDDDGASVKVTTRDGQEHTASVAVVATSGNMWSRIRFSRPLSDVKRNASQRGLQTPNALTKLWALVRGDVENVYVQRPNHKDHPIIHLRKDHVRENGLTQVIGFCIDPTLDSNDHALVARLFKETLPNPDVEVVAVIGQNWVQDEFTMGGTSLLRPGQLSALRELRAAEGNLAFATADISNSLPGFDGAVETGINGAREALKILRQREN